MYTKEQIREAWRNARSNGISYFGNIGHNPKSEKSDKKTNYLSYLIYLAPHTQSGKYNVCPMASVGCAKACLYTAGRGRYQNVKDARIKRTKFFFEHRNDFKACVYSEIVAAKRKADREGKKLAIRLNATSDIVWEKTWPEVFTHFKDLAFYDYTPNFRRMLNNWKLPKNYHLTLSRKEDNDHEIQRVIKDNRRANVAVVFDKLPKTYLGRKVIDGDEHDLRIIDKKGVIVGLKQKGRARHDTTGFVVRLPILESKVIND